MSEVSTTGIEVSEFVNMEQMMADVKIDITQLDTEMQQHASLYVMYASNAVRAKRQYERFKAVLELLEAQLDREHRTALKEENAKTTEGQIRASIVTDPRWRAASGKVIDAQQLYRLADVAVYGFDQRKDMLLQIARNAAREQAGPLRVVSNADALERMEAAMDKTKAMARAA